MKRYFKRFWILVTIVISILFIALILPLASRNIGFTKALSYTTTGLAVIWIVYFVRAYVFSDNSKEDQNRTTDHV